MKYLFIFFCFAFNNPNCFSQIENFCPCEHLSTTNEDRFKQEYKNKPCLKDFVMANIVDTLLIPYIGKQADYIEISNKYCNENKAIFSIKTGLSKQSITILKSPFYMSEEKYDTDTIILKGYDFVYYKRISIEGHPFLGVQYHNGLYRGIKKEQSIVSEIKVEWDDKNIVIPLKNHFLLFNPNFCKKNSYGTLKPIKIYDIGENKLAIYFHGKPRYTSKSQADYIAKVIVDKKEGYVGTIFMRNHDLEMYGWSICQKFQGF